jgi:hypothetical protein
VVAGNGEGGMLLTTHLTQHTQEDKNRKNLYRRQFVGIQFYLPYCYVIFQICFGFLLYVVDEAQKCAVLQVCNQHATGVVCNVSLSEFLIAEFLCFCVKLLVGITASVNRTFWD